MDYLNIKVSIIVPAYNAEKYLNSLLPNVINQTYKNIEIVIIDDGSTDKTPTICKDYLEKDPRIVYARKTNGGVSAARNYGIEISTGEYIVFVDADDIPKKNYVETLLSNLIEQKVDYVCASYRLIKTRNRTLYVIYEAKVYQDEDFLCHLYEIMKKYANAPWGKIFNREKIIKNNIKFPEGVPYAEDSIFLYSYLRYIKSSYISDAIIYDYNYTNIESAARKYYPDFYKYLDLRITMLEECLFYHEMKEQYKSYINSERLKCFNSCLYHYIINSKENTKIEKSARTFHISEFDNIYKAKTERCQWKSIRRIWILKNLKLFLQEKFKQAARI